MAENTYIPYDYIPVIDSTISGSVEKDNLILTFCIPKTDTLSTGVVIKMQNPVTGASLLKEELLYKSRESFIEEAVTESSTLTRFKVNISGDDLISPMSIGDSYQCWVRMTQVEPQELKCDHVWSDWMPYENKQHRRICPRCGKKEVYPCEFEGSTEIVKNEFTHTQNCKVCKGNGVAEEHSGTFYLYTKTNHKRVCDICSWVTDEVHSFQYEYLTEKTHKCVCYICGNKQQDSSILAIIEKHTDEVTKNHVGEIVSNSPDKLCDFCEGAYELGKAEFIASEADPSVLEKIIISGSAIEEIVIPKEFKTISPNVITTDNQDATETEVQAIKNTIKSIIFEVGSVCEEIKENAFGFCEQLSLIDLPDTIKSIGKHAFTNSDSQGSSDMKIVYDGPEALWKEVSIDLPWAPSTASYQFTPKESSELRLQTQTNGTAIVIGQGDWSPSPNNNYQLVIPKYYKGCPVVSISTSAFEALSNLQSIYLPSQLQEINAGAFSNCKLTSIELSPRSQLQKIGEEVFVNNNIQSVDFSKCAKLYALSRKVFKDCVSLKQVLLPGSISEIYEDTFAFCSQIDITIENPQGNYYTTSDGSLYQKTKTGEILLTAGYKMTTILNNTIKIAPYAFAGRKLKSYGIRIPDSVTDISEYAFYRCYLSWVRLPSNITTLKAYTFAHSFDLKYIENLSVNINLIEVGALSECPSLEIITYTGLRKYFYYDNTKDWPNGTTKESGWDTGTFNYRMIYKYNEPQFYTPCSYITDVDPRYCVITGLAEGVPEDLIQLTIPFEINGKMVKKVAANAFSGCYNVENIILPETLEEIGDGAFYNAGIYTPSFWTLLIPSKVTKIGAAAFSGSQDYALPYTKIKFAFENDLLTIGTEAFAYCSNAYEINFGEISTLQKIGDKAFLECTKVWRLDFPYSLESIGASAFAECKNLEYMYFLYDNNINAQGLDEGIKLKYIGDKAFYHCNVLTKVFLTEAVFNDLNSVDRNLHNVFTRETAPSSDNKLKYIHFTGPDISIDNFYHIFNKADISDSVSLYCNWGAPVIPGETDNFSFSIDSKGVLTMTIGIGWKGGSPIFFPRVYEGKKVTKIILQNYRDSWGYLDSYVYLHDLIESIQILRYVSTYQRSTFIWSKHAKPHKADYGTDTCLLIVNSNATNLDRLDLDQQWVEFKENDLIQSPNILKKFPDSPGSSGLRYCNFPEGMSIDDPEAFSFYYSTHLREFTITKDLQDSFEFTDWVQASRSLFIAKGSLSNITRIRVQFEPGCTKVKKSLFLDARPFDCYLPSSITTLESKSFYTDESSAGENIIYYQGSQSQWEKIVQASDAFNSSRMPQIVYLKQDPPQTFKMTRTMSTRAVEEIMPDTEIVSYEPYNSLILQYPEGFSSWSKASVFNLIDMPRIQIDPTYLNAKRIGVISGLFSAKYDNLKWYQVQFDTGEISDRIYPKNNNVFDYTFIAPEKATSFTIIYMTKKGYYATTEQEYQLYEYTSAIQESQDIELTKVNIVDNADLGSIDMTITVHSNIGDQLGHLLVERTSLNSQFSKWETLRDIWLIIKQSYPDQQIVIQDLFAEPGVPYQYRIQFLWDEDQYRTNIFESNNYHILTAEDIYLTSKDLQMRICYNPQITGVKRNVSDAITTTIGSKYPMVRRNGHQDYLTFQISGLISYNAEIFSDLNDINILKDRDSITGDIGEEYLDYEHNQFKNSLFFNTSLFEDYAPQYYKLLDKKEQTVILEKIFRNKVMDFLYGDDIKLFKSLTEGNKFIRLTNVSFTPNQQLGRNIYSFSATATEVADCTINNYHKYLLQDSEITFSEYDYVALASGKIIEDNIINYYVQPQELMKMSKDDNNYAIILRRDIVPGGVR